MAMCILEVETFDKFHQSSKIQIYLHIALLMLIFRIIMESKRFGKENKQKTIHKNCGNKRDDLENSTSIATASGLGGNKAKNFDKKEMNASTSSDDEEDEWEAVEPIHARQNKKASEKVVEVNLEGKAAEKFKANLMNPLEICSAKKEEERIKWEHWMRLEVERKQRELQEDLHRIHFLAFIAHLRFIVSALVKHRQLLIEKMGTIHGFSTMPTSIVEMEKLLREVFRPNFQNQSELFSSKSPLSWYKDDKTLIDHLCWLIERKGFSNDKEISMLFFAYCAFLLELPTRICLAFNPMPRLMKLPKYLKEKKASKSKAAAKNSKKIKEKSNVMEEIKKNLIRRMPTRSTAKKQRLTEQEADNAVEEIDENDPSDEEEISDEEESSEEEEQMKKKSLGGRKRKRSAVMKNGGKEKFEVDKGLDEEKEAQKLNASRVYWNEYWEEREQKWISVDAFFNSVDVPTKIEQKFGDKMLYVLAIDNDFGVCEVAGKYLSDFLALETRKLRTDPDWLQQTLNYPFLCVTNTARQQFEDAAILELLRSKPFPQKLAEYKNHPLYALKKDLLKFEAIYPENQVPLGTIAVGRTGNHDIFPRSAVHKLEGSLNWIKESRSIKKGEKPYKIVKARPKTNIPKEKRTPLTLDLYGFWQTEPYVPPLVVDGKIPRNEFGNIYMYKDEMLPNGCVHLRLNGIFNVARRLNLEAVPAVVGWEFSGGVNHPILDGCVVLKNDKEVLCSAWSEMARNKAENEAKKNNERVWKNWRRLVRSKLMLEKMRNRFK